MQFMSKHNPAVAEAGQVSALIRNFSEVLSNTLETAMQGLLSDKRGMTPNNEVMTTHGFGK